MPKVGWLRKHGACVSEEQMRFGTVSQYCNRASASQIELAIDEHFISLHLRRCDTSFRFLVSREWFHNCFEHSYSVISVQLLSTTSKNFVKRTDVPANRTNALKPSKICFLSSRHWCSPAAPDVAAYETPGKCCFVIQFGRQMPHPLLTRSFNNP